MPRKKLTLAEKMAPIFRKYDDLMPALIKVNPKQYFPADYWAPLKIYCLASYVHTCYSKIIGSRIENTYFIDLMSNSGINYVDPCKNCGEKEKCRDCRKKRKPKIYMVGSTLVASTSKPPFKKIYFVDNDPEKVKTLSTRLDILKGNGFPEIDYQPIIGNCNEKIDEILSEIKGKKEEFRKYHILAFADNEGLDVEWKTIEKLLLSYCDLIINFPASNLNRVFGQPSSFNTKKLDAFFGCDVKNKVKDQSKLLELYCKRIKEIKPEVRVEAIRINTNIGYYYDLIIVAKDGEYWKYIENLKKNIEENSAQTVENIIPVITGQQKTLADFPR